jgi:hypothetical protein
MQTVLITLVGPTRQVDLKLPAEVLVGDLFPKLLELCGLPTDQHQAALSQWRLVLPTKGLVLPFNRSLRNCGVVDGTKLALQDHASFVARQQQVVQTFRPQGVQPSASTGGIGVKWNIPNR